MGGWYMSAEKSCKCRYSKSIQCKRRIVRKNVIICIEKLVIMCFTVIEYLAKMWYTMFGNTKRRMRSV